MVPGLSELLEFVQGFLSSVLGVVGDVVGAILAIFGL